LEGGEDEGAVRFLLGFNGEEVSGVGFLSHVDSFTGMEVMDKYVSEGLSLGAYLPALTADSHHHNHHQHQQQQHQQQQQNMGSVVLPGLTQIKSPVAVRQAHSSLSSSGSNSSLNNNNNNGKKRDTSGAKAIHNCDSCGKCFTTKFNLKRHINMHCHKSKENGIPIQGPPSASAPAKKTIDKPGTPSGCSLKLVPDNNTAGELTGSLTHPLEQSGQMANHQTVLPPSQSLLHSSTTAATSNEGLPLDPYQKSADSRQTSPGSSGIADEFQGGPEPDSTYRLPSVQTLLPAAGTTVSSGYTAAATAVVVCCTSGVSTYSTMTTPSCDTSHIVVASSESSSSSIQLLPSSGTNHNNTDYGTLPADLFDPDSSKSEPPATPPTAAAKPGQTGLWADRGEEDDLSAPAVILTSVPAGWTKKVCFEGGRLRNKFCSPLGKIFSSHEEISQYFKTFNYAVPLGLFKFDAHFDEDDSEEEEDEEDDMEDSDEDEDSERSSCAKRRKSETEVMSPAAAETTTPSPPLSSLTA
jgi:hypothetical protein